MFPNHVHFINNTLWVSMRFLDCHMNHAGYDFPFNFFGLSYIKKLETTNHNYHHFRNIGNYGSMFAFWDDYFGTSKTYNKEIKENDININK